MFLIWCNLQSWKKKHYCRKQHCEVAKVFTLQSYVCAMNDRYAFMVSSNWSNVLLDSISASCWKSDLSPWRRTVWRKMLHCFAYVYFLFWQSVHISELVLWLVLLFTNCDIFWWLMENLLSNENLKVVIFFSIIG